MNSALRDEVARWLRYAKEDLVEAQKLVREEDSIPRHAAWFAQQAAEKALKAVLVYEQIDFPRTHDLNALLRLIPKTWAVHDVDVNLERLSAYAVEARYPVRGPEITASEASDAVLDANAIVSEIAGSLGRKTR